MAIIDIVTIPQPVLKKQTKRVTEFGGRTRRLIRDLKDTLDAASEPEGAGISANQVGVSKSVCVVRDFFLDPANPENELFKEHVLINPRIISASDEKELGWEGCLSIPGVYGQVQRSIKIKIRYQDEEGHRRQLTAKDFFARVIQHEVDHLNGVLFTEKVVGKTVDEDYFKTSEEEEKNKL